MVLALVIALFSIANWNPITISIWPGQLLDTKLPLLIIAALLVGGLPMWTAWRTARWSLKKRLDSSERQLADLRAIAQYLPDSNLDE